MAGSSNQPNRPKIKLKPPSRVTGRASAANPTYRRGAMSREQVLDEVNRLDLQGYTPVEIASRMGVKPSQILKDLKDVRLRYAENMQRDREADVRRKVAQLEQVRSQAWEAWEKSKRDKTRRVTEYVAGPPPKPGPGDRFKPGKPVVGGNTGNAAPLSHASFQESMRKLKRVVTVHSGTAESTYLTIITTTLRMEAELLGLFPDMKLQVGVGGGVGQKPAITPDEWMMLAAPLPDDGLAPIPPPRYAEAEEADPVEAEILRLEAQAAAPPQRPVKTANGKH